MILPFPKPEPVVADPDVEPRCTGARSKVLVTGGAGFIGSHVVDSAAAKGYDVVVVDDLSVGRACNVHSSARLVRLDIRDPALMGLVAGEQPDVVCHFAAQTDTRAAHRDPILDADVNTIGTLNVLRSCVAAGVRKIVFASTAAVYGDANSTPIAETHPPMPRNEYGVSKLAAERYLPVFHSLHGLEFVVLRFANVYGPRQRTDGETGVVATFATRMLEAKACTMFGDGHQSRDFVFVEDCARLVARMIAEDGSFRTYNVGTGSATTILSLHRELAELTGANQMPVYAPRRPFDVHHFRPDVTRLWSDLGWRAQTTLSEGVRRTLSYLRAEVSA